jgi:hypothetical protein
VSDAAVALPSGNGDADGDGVLDRCDQCPLDPETYNELDDEDGCPDCALPRTATGVVFEAGSAVVDEWSVAALQWFVRQRRAEVDRLAVVARAAADEPAPQALSERRAAAVVGVLTAAGLDRAKIDVLALGAMPAPAEGGEAELLGRRTSLVVVSEGGNVIAWDEGVPVLLVAGREPPMQPSPPGCPGEARAP